MVNLNLMLKELSNYHRPRAQLYQFYIQNRLNQSVNSYDDAMTKSSKYLQQKNELKVLKKANRL